MKRMRICTFYNDDFHSLTFPVVKFCGNTDAIHFYNDFFKWIHLKYTGV